ncbi:MAG TPA: hypothetical protein VKU85_08315, partial [bacterium]|nr:hypothetical protein [bacterium]
MNLLRLLGPLTCGWLLTASASAADPAADWDVRVRALEAYRARDWPLAAELHAQCADANPVDGALWERYGLALHNSGRHDEAVPAFEKCIELGYRTLEARYNVACACARAGRVREALDALDDAYAQGFVNDHLVRTDHDLDALRGERRFAEITGLPAEPDLPRADRWREDLRYLDVRLRRLHFDLFAQFPEEEYVHRLGSIAASVPDRSDDELRWDVQGLLARIGDGHTTVVSERFRAMHGGEAVAFDVYPVELWWHHGEDGLRIRRVAADRAWAAGGEVTSIGGRPVSEALEAALSVTSRDNEQSARWMAMDVLASPSAMRALGLAGSDGSLSLTVRTNEGARPLVLEAAAFEAGRAMADASDG